MKVRSVRDERKPGSRPDAELGHRSELAGGKESNQAGKDDF